jgi:surface antigen
LKAHTARKLANKLGVYKAWSAANTDKEAQAVLDAAAGVKRKVRTPQTPLQRLLSAVKGVSEVADLETAEREITARKAALEAAETAALTEAAK